MEKRRVRIYKTGGEQGAYINKTMKYFQEGGIQQEDAPPAPTDEQIIQFIMQTLSQPNGSIEQAHQQLLQANIDNRKIQELSSIALEYIDEQRGTQPNTALVSEVSDDNQMVIDEEVAQAEAQAAQEQAQLQDIYNQDSTDNGEYDQAEADIIMRNGGIPNKKQYINNFVKLAKKQKGGDTEQSKSDLSTDIPIGGRTEKLNNFLNTVKDTANTEALKKQAEEQYNMYMQQQQQPYIQDSGVGDMNEFQFGGWRQRRAARRMNRMIPQGFNPMMNPFMQNNNPLAQFMPNQGNLGLANIDVRRTGIFGRPKEYTINFNSPTPIRPQDIENTRKQVEVNIDEALKDGVASTEVIPETPVSTTTTSDTLPTQEEIFISDNKNKNKGKNISGVSSNTSDVVTDQWGRPEGDKWYNFNPETKSFNTTSSAVDRGTGVIQSAIDKANKYPDTVVDSNVNYKIPSWQENVKNIFPSYGQPNQTPRYNQLTQRLPPSADKWYEYQDPFNLKWTPEKQYGGFQEGGFTDEESGLYRFIGGGEDMSQMDLDYSNSKNVASPYFQSGGYLPQAQNGIMHPQRAKELQEEERRNQIDNPVVNQTAGQTDSTAVDILDANGNVVRKGTLAEAERAGLKHRVISSNTNTSTNNKSNFSQGDGMGGPDYAQQYLQNRGMQLSPGFRPPGAITRGGNWNKAIGNPYMTRTGNPISGMIGPNAQVSSIDVNKTRRFGPNAGMPKKFTVNYNVPGQPGINATGTPQSYKGSDGQMHWLGSDQYTKDTTGASKSRRRPIADALLQSGIHPLEQLGSRMYPWEENSPEKSTTGYHGKDDENYKKIYGHYPGEDPGANRSQDTVDSLPTKPLESAIDQEKNILPGDLRASNIPNINTVGSLPTRELDKFTNTASIIPGDNRSNPNYNMGQEPLPLEFGQAGNMTEEEAAFEQQRMQDAMGSGLNLLGRPNAQQNYMQQSADENMVSKQDWELEQMRRQDPNYFNQTPYNVPLDLTSLDYTQLVGPQAIQQQQFNKPVNQQQRNVNSRVRNNNNVSPENWADAAMNNMNRQQRAKFQTKEGVSYNKLQDLKASVQGSNIQAFRESAQNIDPSGKKIFRKMTPTQQLNYLNKLKNQDRGLYEGYINLLQEGGTLPKAQFGNSESKIPFGYFKDPSSGLYKNIAGDIYTPKTNLEGASDKLMNNNDLAMSNDYSNPLTGQSPGIKMGADGNYQNEGILSDAEKEASSSQQVSQKFKNKQEWNINGAALMDQVNTFGNQFASAVDQWNSAKQNRNQGNRYNADNLYSTNYSTNRGDYDQEGRFRLDQQGDDGLRYGRQGGSLENIETWMSEEQIQQFLAEGGELEFV
jgi:hypothetical protein